MSDYIFLDDRRYAPTHEWAKVEGDIAIVGISDYAQHALSDVVYVELPEVGTQVSKGDPVAVVESVKAAEDVYAPLSGEIVEINEELPDNPEWVNEDPYGKAWFFKIKMSNPAEYDELLDVEAYKKVVEEEEH